MIIDLEKVSYEGRTFEFGESKLTIRPYPASRTDVAFKGGAVIFSGGAGFDMFDYCLVAWENVGDAKGKAIQLTAEVKKKIYDFRLGKTKLGDGSKETMADFVLKKARELGAEIEGDVKN